MSKNIAIIGSGITGILSAYYLAKAGHQITVIEQERYPAMKTSFANGGQISVSNSEVWTTWTNVWKGMKWIFKKDAPLLIRPELDLDKINWLFKFLWHTAKDEYSKNTIETIRLGLDSRIEFNHIIKEEKISFDQNYCGILHFYKNEKYFQNAILVKDLYENNGCKWKILNSADDVKRLDPALEDIQGILGGAWTPTDWVGDIHEFCVELKKILETKYSVKFHFNEKVFSLKNILNDFDQIVVSAGVGSKNLAKSIGDNLSIYPVKGYSITINLDEENLKYCPNVSLLDDEAKIVTSKLGNRLRVAGTAELTGENYDIRRDRIEPLLNWVHLNLPKINTKNYSSWACLRPMTPNMLPIIKQSISNKKVYYHTGHGHLGWTISPSTAKTLSNMIGN